MTNDIPAGYQLHVHCWENDADNYSLKVLSGLTKADVDFYLCLLGKFKSKNHRADPGLGNSYVSPQQVAQAVLDALTRYPGGKAASEFWRALAQEGLEGNDDGLYEALTDLLGAPGEYYYDGPHPFYRVFDRYEVFHLPQGAANVTQEFLHKR